MAGCGLQESFPWVVRSDLQRIPVEVPKWDYYHRGPYLEELHSAEKIFLVIAIRDDPER